MAAPIVLLKNRKFLFKAAILSAFAEPIGAIIGLLAVNLFPSMNPLFMSFAAGAMIFVSLHELIPLAERYRRRLFFILGIALSIIVYLALHFFIPG